MYLFDHTGDRFQSQFIDNQIFHREVKNHEAHEWFGILVCIKLEQSLLNAHISRGFQLLDCAMAPIIGAVPPYENE